MNLGVQAGTISSCKATLLDVRCLYASEKIQDGYKLKVGIFSQNVRSKKRKINVFEYSLSSSMSYTLGGL